MRARARYNGGPSNTQDEPPSAAGLFGPVLARGDEPPLPSLAHDLQIALEAEFARPRIRKWHPLARSGFIVGVCGGFWSLVALAVLGAL